MTGLLLDNIGSLVTNDPGIGQGPLGLVRDAAVIFEGGVVAWAGPRSKVPGGGTDTRVDAEGRAVIPGFVDSHAHLVFAGGRALHSTWCHLVTRRQRHRYSCYCKTTCLTVAGMGDTITIRTDEETEHALDVLTHDGSSRSAAIRQAVLDAARRRERAAEMRRAVLRMDIGEPDGINVAEELARDRASER